MQVLVKKIIILTVGVLLAATMLAQEDPSQAIDKISKAYNRPYAIMFHGSIKMYAKNDPRKTIEKIESNYIMKEGNFSCSIGSVVMMLNDKYYVSADKSVKIMVVGQRKQLSGTEQLPVVNLARFKQLLIGKSIRSNVLSAGAVSVLQLTDPQAITGYNVYRIHYNSTTGYIQKVTIEVADANDSHSKKMVLEISYSTPVKAVMREDPFSEKKFFLVNKKRVVVQPPYENYQLINQL